MGLFKCVVLIFTSNNDNPPSNPSRIPPLLSCHKDGHRDCICTWSGVLANLKPTRDLSLLYMLSLCSFTSLSASKLYLLQIAPKRAFRKESCHGTVIHAMSERFVFGFCLMSLRSPSYHSKGRNGRVHGIVLLDPR